MTKKSSWRKQAEIIASALGKEIIGIESINDNKYRVVERKRKAVVKNMEIECPQFLQKRNNLTDQAGVPREEKEMSVTISWIISE